MEVTEVSRLDPIDQAAEVQATSDWLVTQGLLKARTETLVEGFCERVGASGIPLLRGQVSIPTLHPTFNAITYVWWRDKGIETRGHEHGSQALRAWQESPFRFMAETRTNTLRRRLEGPDAVIDFPILAELRGLGATDYFARITPFGSGGKPQDGNGMLASWTGDRPGGFSEHDIAILERLQPRLGLAVNMAVTDQIAHNVMDAYVGPDAGRRVLNGEIRRGSLQVIRAVLWYADLRGFTALADRTPREELVSMLDEYFDCMAEPLTNHGGQVLKFMGDGMLGTFNLKDRPRQSICRDAINAAAEALDAVARLNEERSRAGKPTMLLDLALHLGDVLYGNVGSADRLDFTVVGPAVNEASRIETLCQALGSHLLISQTLAAAAKSCSDRLVSLGRHKLRGVRESQELFTLKDAG